MKKSVLFVTIAFAVFSTAVDAAPRRQHQQHPQWDHAVRDHGRCFDHNPKTFRPHSNVRHLGPCVRGVDPDPFIRSQLERDRHIGDGGDDPF